MEQNNVICGNCGTSCKPSAKFCEECGKPLNIIDPKAFDIEDKHLTMLVDTCNKVCGLAAGERYEEYVLYKDEQKNSYEIHWYSKQGVGKERHKGYFADSKYAESILETIKNDNMSSLNQDKETPICGGEFILKFVDQTEKVIRLCGGAGEIKNAQSKIDSMLRAGIDSDRMIVTEYAANWVKAFYSSTGMNMQNCYSFELERISDDKYRVRKINQMTNMMNSDVNWVDIPSEIGGGISRLHLGMQFSLDKTIKTIPQLAMLMKDAESKQCQITYADGKTDEKIVDSNMLNKLLELVREYII